MLLAPRHSRFSFTYDNWGATPTTTIGTSVTPGASGAEGSWTQVATGANIAYDICGIYVRVGAGAGSATFKAHLLDIGVDPAGGTSYTAIINDMMVSESAAQTSVGAGREHFFPMSIKAGSSVAVRVKGNASTAGTVRVWTKFYGGGSAQEMMPCGTYSETIGVTGTAGVSFTPGNAADGSWVSLGTTTNNLWWWQIGHQVNNTTITADVTYVDLAYGDVTNKHIITRVVHNGTTGETVGWLASNQLVWHECYCPVPGGSTLYVRGRSDAAPDTGYEAMALGIGG
jgi:hypothetical protein